MKLDRPIKRREFVRNLLQWSGYLTVAGAARLTLCGMPEARAATTNKRFLVEGIGKTDNFSVKDLIKKVFDAAGGVNRFVSRGDVVVIKPNISWARPPHLAATTNPEVLQGVVELCQACNKAPLASPAGQEILFQIGNNLQSGLIGGFG